MKLLLDTCSCLWALHDPDRLSAHARRSIQDSANDVRVSVISFWEISLKAGLGKLVIKGVEPEDYPALALQAGWIVHPLAPEIAASSAHLRYLPDHRDPFDRLLVWTAIREGFALVSGDAAFPRYASHGLKICW